MGRLGAALRADGPGWADGLRCGAPVDGAELERRVGTDTVAALVAARLAAAAGHDIRLAFTVADVGGVLTAIPKAPWGPEVSYLGEDSAYLIEAALRLAPRGRRAADLGTGTGLAAAVLASRYTTVVGTDVAPGVTGAAALTLALNPIPSGHAVGLCTTDVAGGLRDDAFDLVVANAPWVPLAPASEAPRELFAHGGDHGVELPARFLRQGAALLAVGGTAITLALDVELHGGLRPLRDVGRELVDDGFVVARLATPFNRDRPRLAETMAQRQPEVTAATHVAVVVARPSPVDPSRRSLAVAVEALRRRWAGARPAQASGSAEP